MGYTTNSSHVRVDRFKESGKWYDTLEIDMEKYYYSWDIYKAVADSINDTMDNESYVKDWLDQGGSFVCLEPYYHGNPFPIMLRAYSGA